MMGTASAARPARKSGARKVMPSLLVRSSYPHQPFPPAQILEQREVQGLRRIEQRIVYAGVHQRTRERSHVLLHQLTIALALLVGHHRDAIAALQVLEQHHVLEREEQLGGIENLEDDDVVALPFRSEE